MIKSHYEEAARAIPYPNSYAHIDDSGFYRDILADTTEHLRNLLAMRKILKEDVVTQKLRAYSDVSQDIRNMKQELSRIEITLSKVFLIVWDASAVRDAAGGIRQELNGLKLDYYKRSVVMGLRDIIRESSVKSAKHFLAFIM